MARVYRHPYQVHQALEAGATWEQIAEATGTDEARSRQEYRKFAEGQHRLWTGGLGGSAGRFGMNDAGYAAAIARVEQAVSAGRAAVERTLDAARIAVIKARPVRGRAFIASAADRATPRRAMRCGRRCGRSARGPAGGDRAGNGARASGQAEPTGLTGADRGLVIHGLQALTPLRLRRKEVLSDGDGPRRTRAVPPICAAVPVHWVTVVAAPNRHLGRNSVLAQIRDIGRVFKAAIGLWFPTFRVVYQNYVQCGCARPRGVNSPTVSAAPSTAGSTAGLRRLRTTPAARRPASAIAALPGSS